VSIVFYKIYLKVYKKCSENQLTDINVKSEMVLILKGKREWGGDECQK